MGMDSWMDDQKVELQCVAEREPCVAHMSLKAATLCCFLLDQSDGVPRNEPANGNQARPAFCTTYSSRTIVVALNCGCEFKG
jgi:hypothetical protein